MTANTEGGAFATASRRATAPPLADRALAASRGWLIDAQQDEGYWIGELEGDSILESEYVLLMAYLGRLDEPACVKMARTIRDEQNAEGGWSIYPGGPSQVSATVKAYFVLKLLGTPVDDPRMARAREVVLRAGGARACNSFTRFYLALLGQIPYSEVPYVPPELLLVPPKLPFSLASMSSWTRTIIVPLMILSVFKPCRPLAPERGIAELYLDGPPPRPKHGLFSWASFFVAADRAMKWADRITPRALRKVGIRAAHRWMLDHFENSDGLGAIFPPMIYTVVALKCLGYGDDSAAMGWALQQLEDLRIEEGPTIRVQPCLSPVWDTAIATLALADSGAEPDHPAFARSVRWLLDKEVRVAGDWIARGGIHVEPTGWHFQHQNERYPDIDDTAMVILALQRTEARDEPEVRAATNRAVAWLLALQNSDGGWAAYDRDINNEVLTKVPFADHNAMLDPSCADITMRVVEMLGVLGHRADHPSIARALDYTWKTQEPEGCWYGRWGVNYIYGTWQVLQGLKAINFPMDHPAVVRAADWLESVQQGDGGWGETCLSYDDPSYKGKGDVTPSQTAWAVLGLVAAGRADGDAARSGVRRLIETQEADGTWFDATYTGTGFPSVFYLRYHLYPISFPVMAIARHRAALEA